MESAKQLSGYLRPGEQSEPVFTGNIQKEGYFIEKYFIEGEMNYIIPYLLFVPEKQNKKALIYIHPSGKLTDSISETEIEWFVNKGFVVLVPDLLGTGETGPGDALLDAHFGNALFRMWHASILINKSLAGIRAEDVVKLTHILKAYQKTEEIYCLAKGSMSPVILHAAAFEPSIKKVALIEPYSSYHSIVNNRFYSREFIHNAVAGALHFYDLPDLAASLAPKKLLMLNVMDGAGEQYNKESLENELSFIRRVYREKKSEDSLKIAVTGPDKPVNIFLQEWINLP